MDASNNNKKSGDSTRTRSSTEEDPTRTRALPVPVPTLPPLQQVNQGPGQGLHRRRTLYLVRHGQALHNVLEVKAQEDARLAAQQAGIRDATEIAALVEQARQGVLQDASLLDAPLTDLGRQQAKETGQQLARLVQVQVQHHACSTTTTTTTTTSTKSTTRHLHPPTEAMVSPLSRCLETAELILQQHAYQKTSHHGSAHKEGDEEDEEEEPLLVHIRPELRERQTQYPPDTPSKNPEALLHWTQQRYTNTTSTSTSTSTSPSDNSASASASASQHQYYKFHLPPHSTLQQSQEEQGVETKAMLRQRAAQLFHVLMECSHTHILIVSHKGYLREMERGLLGIDNSPLFANAELRVYQVEFTRGNRQLTSCLRVV